MSLSRTQALNWPVPGVSRHPSRPSGPSHPSRPSGPSHPSRPSQRGQRTMDHKVYEREPVSLSCKVSATLETVLKAKLHRLVVTETNLDYEGSIEIGTELMEAAGIRPYEQVLIANFTNGSRAWTYAIPHGKGQVRLNGG